MKIIPYLLLELLLLQSCHQQNQPGLPPSNICSEEHVPAYIGAIPLPEGFTRPAYEPGTFASWLRGLTLKADKTVYLYNGQPKKNQSAQFAVLDQPCSKTDLQQCADVLMRLRAEYLFQYKRYTEIRFTDFEGHVYAWHNSNNRDAFEQYMSTVFGWCGSASLEKQLNPVTDFSSIEPGDVLIRGGFPGHAVMVADMALNDNGDKIFLLVQGYQPAQDMHVLLNPVEKGGSPWYHIPVSDTLNTPEWIFYKSQLRSW